MALRDQHQAKNSTLSKCDVDDWCSLVAIAATIWVFKSLGKGFWYLRRVGERFRLLIVVLLLLASPDCHPDHRRASYFNQNCAPEILLSTKRQERLLRYPLPQLGRAKPFSPLVSGRNGAHGTVTASFDHLTLRYCAFVGYSALLRIAGRSVKLSAAPTSGTARLQQPKSIAAHRLLKHVQSMSKKP